jgi:predicted ester cyclase
MGIEENKETVRRYIKEILNDLDYTHFSELAHDDFFGMGGTIKNVEEHEKFFKAQRERIPDGANQLQEMIAEGDKVVAISLLTYTDTAGVAGHPPTNKPANMKVIVVYTLKDGKIVKGEPLMDSVGAARSVGHTTVNFG